MIELDSVAAVQRAAAIRESVSAQVAEGLDLELWAFDSLVPDPIALSIDPQGRVYITGTNRRRSGEIDIRGHRPWMTASIALQSVEERRQFLHDTLAPERSADNEWLEDMNGDGSHDWRDLTVPKEQVFRLEDRDGDGIADRAQLFAEGFNSEVSDVAGALLVHERDVFLGVAPDLWRLHDRDGDGAADQYTSISHGFQAHIGFGGHNMSGLTVGPDGRIYWGIGDIGMNVVDQQGKRWQYPNQGVIVRCNPDGSDFEVFAHGLRNTHEFVFDDYGNLISVDNDGDHPGEMERIVYIVNGSDSGWRINWQFGKYGDPKNNDYKVWMDEQFFLPRFEGQAAYITPPIANYHSGPAGMKYNPGTALGPSWKNHFFVSEFTGSPARSRIMAFRLQPRGAGFEFAGEREVLKGVLVTGIDFGPDGALYLGDWIEGWVTKDYGRIWKLDDPQAANTFERQQTRELLAADFSNHPVSKLAALLGHADQRVRRKAQFALARRGPVGAEALIGAVRGAEEQLARIHGLWGLWQLARQDGQYAEKIRPVLADPEPELRAQAAKVLGDIRYRKGGEALIPLLRDSSSRVRFFAAEALGRMEYAAAVQPLIALLAANDDRDVYLRHAGALALARIGDPAPLVALADHPSRALRLAAVVALRRMGDPAVARFLDDPDEWVVTEAARAINDDFSIEAALPDLARLLRRTPFHNEALIRRVINANLRAGQTDNVSLLADYATRQDVPPAMRAEAIAALGVWPRPSVLDRVTGRYRGVIERPASAARKTIAGIIDTLLHDENTSIQVAAAQTAGRLHVAASAPLLLDLSQRDPIAVVRIAALESLHRLNDPRVEKAVEVALRDEAQSVRSSALTLLPSLELPPSRTVELFAAVLEEGSLEERQTAIAALATMPPGSTAIVLGDLMEQLIAGRLDPGIQLDLIEAAEAAGRPDLQQQLDRFRAGAPQDDPLALYRACLEGGDVEGGRRIFAGNETAQCVRCHALGDWGGNVGPPLGDIGARLSRQDLLLALVDPSDRIAPGYGFLTLTLTDGETVSGIVLEETDQHLLLEIDKANTRKLPKAEIASRQSAPSSMPPMGNLLNRREIRDLVAFLASLSGEES